MSKVTLNAANERPLSLWCVMDHPLGQGVGEKCAVEQESVVRRPVGVISLWNFKTDPTGTRRNNNIIMTSKRRRGVVSTS